MDRARLKTLILYHIYSSKVLVGILLLIMFVNLLLGIAFKHSINSAGSMDIASYIFALFVGYELFREVFAFSMINGVSRKTYYISNILSTIIISVFLGVTTGVVSFISSVLANNSIMFYMIYPKNTANMFIWCTVMTYAIISLFHFIALVMYRISKKTKYIIILLLALSVPFIILLIIWPADLLCIFKNFSSCFWASLEAARILPLTPFCLLPCYLFFRQ